MKVLVFMCLGLLLGSCDLLESKRPEDKFRKAYQNNFGFVPDPILYVYSSDWQRYTSTHYRDGFLYRVYYNDNGGIDARTFEPSLPSGTKKTLVIIPIYDELLPLENFDRVWVEEQEEINLQHRDFALEQNYAEPVVQFTNKNVYVDMAVIDFAKAESLYDSVRLIMNERNEKSEDFDHIVFLDLNLKIPSGGWADVARQLVTVGWIHTSYALDNANLSGIANAVYHHEIGHLWGWEHAWSDADTSNIFITPPELFGWQDTNGNGIADVIDLN